MVALKKKLNDSKTCAVTELCNIFPSLYTAGYTCWRDNFNW